ncbi:hypothetical protein GCM10010531_39000 [Blastococcus jejuensis]|uniref:AAA+ ATPase domain-containing protein n=1 Tax=Blastococcus jejuensis TaxID=351224 RepID=A0ABP6PJL3_9ACTN
MEQTNYLKILRRRWKIVIASGIVALTAILLLTPTTGGLSESYTATATLLQPPDGRESSGGLPTKVTALLVTTGPVPAAVADRVDYTGDVASLSQLPQVTADPSTGVVTISVTAETASRAAAIADAFAEETIAEATARSGGDDPGVQLLQRAIAQPAHTGPITWLTTRTGLAVVGLVVGLVLGVALALLVERLDTSVRDRTDVHRAYRVPVLAEIPRMRRSLRRAHALVLQTQPASMVAEAYRSLRSSILLIPSHVLQPIGTDDARAKRHAEHSRPQVILVASARSGEGKTTTVANLAAAMAEGGRRVLVLDCDFRRPQAHLFLDVPDGPGLSDLLHAGEGTQDLLALSRPTAVEGVRLVTAGTMVDLPPALPTRIAGILAEARGLADVVIVDSPPMLIGNDAMDLMPYVDTILVSCRSGRLTHDQADRASDLLARMRVPVAGVALVGARPSAPLSQMLPLRGAASSSTYRQKGVRVGEPAGEQ